MKVWIEVCFDWVLKYGENETWFMMRKWPVEMFTCYEKGMCWKLEHESKCRWFKHDSMSMWKTIGLRPHWHCVVKDYWVVSPLALCCERPLGYIPIGTMLWKTTGLRPLWHQAQVKWNMNDVHEHAWCLMWCFKLFS
jgi:hypothetical protein